MLSDRTINNYLKFLEQFYYAKGIKIFTFSTFFFPILNMNNSDIHCTLSFCSPSKLNSYFNDMHNNQFYLTDVNTYSLLGINFLIVPIFTPGYWSPVVYDIQRNIITYADSMPCGREAYMDILKKIADFLTDMFKEHSLGFENPVREFLNFYRQENGIDCGVYLLLNTESIVENIYICRILCME